MSALSLMKSNLQKDIVEYSSKLVSFDNLFDEDALDARHEQLKIITTVIRVKMKEMIVMAMKAFQETYINC